MADADDDGSSCCPEDPCCERDPLNDIPWTIIFVTLVFLALGVMLLYELNARYKAEQACRVKKKPDTATTTEKKKPEPVVEPNDQLLAQQVLGT